MFCSRDILYVLIYYAFWYPHMKSYILIRWNNIIQYQNVCGKIFFLPIQSIEPALHKPVF